MSPAIQPLLASAATFAVAVGVWLLWRAWKRHPRPRGRLIAGGWALLLLAAVLLAPWAGGDRGVAIETLLATVAATVFIIVSGRWTSPKGKKARPIRATAAMISGGADPAIGPATTPLRTVAAVLLALPVSLAASVGVGLVLAIWVPGSQADKLVTAAFGAPLVMAGAMVWTCADRRLLRTTAVLLAVTALCALAVVLRPH